MAVVINEFLAANSSGITDTDGDRSDWIELRNTGPAAVNLGGYYLTDDQNDLDKWQIPATNLNAGAYLTIFASGKNRAVSGQQLHTNFSLEQNGEFLALVMPDGTTIADSFAPFPQQLPDISYGLGAGATAVDTLIVEGAPVRVHVPNAASGIDSTWYSTGFNDASWTAGNAGVGFDNLADGIDLSPFVDLNLAGQMFDASPRRSSAYIRVPFTVADPSVLQNLKLRIRYDDGFGLYLNGTRITSAERAAPATLAWNSAATSSRTPQSAATIYTDIDLTAFKHLLQAGNNVLAIHGLNSSPNSTDFLIDPILQADRALEAVIGYMVTPTPGAANLQGTLGFVADTKFTVDRGFYDSPFNVAITTATAGAEIRYTLDGSAPTATTGLVYNPLSPPLITTTTNLRAAAFKAGYTPSNVDTQTYIFLDHVLQQNGSGLPPYAPWGLSITNPVPDWEMDPAVVNHPTYAGTIKNDLKAVPTVSLTMPWNDWFGGSGQGIYPNSGEIERAVSMEFFTANGSEEFQIDAGIEIQGGTSDDRWKMDKLSMRVKFKEPYGPEKLNANVYHAGARDEGAAISFNTFVLDAHLGMTWAYGGPSGSTQRVNAMFVQDAYVSDLQNLAGGAAPHSRFVHLYINGLYWGLYDMHERADEHFAESYLGGNDNDWDVIKHRTTTEVSGIDIDPGPAYVSSAITNYAAMLALVRMDMTSQANYEAAVAKIDVDDFITYMLVNYYVGNDDWAHQNWYASFNREDPNGKWRYHSWDAENVLKNVTQDSTSRNDSGGPTEVFHRLIVNPEFRLRFSDLVQKYFRNGGLLTPGSTMAIYQARMQEVERALVGESARWGDSRTVPHAGFPNPNDPVGIGNPYLLSHWVTRQNDLLTNYFPVRTNTVYNQFVARGWNMPLGAPIFSHYGGTVMAGYSLTLSRPAGSPVAAVLYYTLDGSDPRDPTTNMPRAGAIAYSGPITINMGVQVNARIFNDVAGSSVNEWSPIIEARFLLPTPFPVRITEINYHPADYPGVADDEDLEFIELTNTGSQTVSLQGVQITQFASNPIVIGSGVQLAAGQRLIIARNPTVFETVYGPGHNVLPTGYGSANLSNGGEQIILLGPIGEELQNFTYSDSGGWPSAADGDGPSLEIINPLGDPNDPANWRASFYINGSPGASGIPGDYDGNGLVEQADHGVWKSRFGDTVAIGTSGDGNRDGVVDLADYVFWRMEMLSPGSSSMRAAAVQNESRQNSPVIESALESMPPDGQDRSRSEPLPLSADFSPTEQLDSRPVFPVIDEAFSRFDAGRPNARRALVRHSLTDYSDDNLLVAVMRMPSASGESGDSDISVERQRLKDQSANRLRPEWNCVDAALRLN